MKTGDGPDLAALHRLPSTVGELDLHLFNQGKHRRLWEVLGAHPQEVEGIAGTAFAVWAPNARRASVVGDFCDWDGRHFVMRPLGTSGVHELFVPGVSPGDLYKFEILGVDGELRLKTDPCAFKHEQYPGTASIVQQLEHHDWGDAEWMDARGLRNPLREPLSVYEVHLSSWARVPEEGNRSLTYREIAPRLAEHCVRLGFTHVEIMPIMEHPFGGSWGYQVTGYFAPTSRHGTPHDFRFLIDTLHQAGLGVILDWVPAHFPSDAHALARFDGTALYEHEDPRLGVHPDWNTLIFNYGRLEVRNFLIASALYWLREYHADGLRVDAVASMLYLDYSREPGAWIPNRFGGRENLEAIEFIRELNIAVQEECPGCVTIAEESTTWQGVTAPVEHGGLGFTFKWNLGWMHDTLDYLAHDPVHRPWHHDKLTFATFYEHTEQFLMPISHDEVVHGKRSLLEKLAGDRWQQFATLRLLLAYQAMRPGKTLLFMGTELASAREWDHDGSLDWHLADDPMRVGLQGFMASLSQVYRERSCFWRCDPDPGGFRWIDCNDRENSVVSFERRDGNDFAVIVLNLTPVPRNRYRIGMPQGGRYELRLNSDAAEFSGSGYPVHALVEADEMPWHGLSHSVALELPPLSVLVLAPLA
jgi:1,4-alpha-glucan branching enzyme